MLESTTKNEKQSGVFRLIGIDFQYGRLLKAGPKYWSFVAILGTLMAVGVAAWFTYFTHGGSVMGMRDTNPWGLWFVNYMYYVGLAAGGLVVYASVHLFGAEQFKPLARVAVLQAAVLTMLALLGIVSDMEMPWRAVNMLLSPNPTSPFVYTGSAAGLYMVLCFVDLWVLITGYGGHKLAHTMTLIALPAAIYLHTTTAFVLALNKAKELWNSAVMVPIFLTSATASGVAFLIIFAYIAKLVTPQLKFKSSMFRSLATLLATVIIIDQFLLIVEIITVFWPNSAKPGHTVRLIEFITGPYAWTLLPVMILGLTSFALLAGRKYRHVPLVQLVASGLYVVAIYFKRYALMTMGFSRTPLGQPVPMYVPSLVEVLLAVGIAAFGLLFLTIGIKLLPVEVPEDEHDHGPGEHQPALTQSIDAEPETGVAAL